MRKTLLQSLLVSAMALTCTTLFAASDLTASDAAQQLTQGESYTFKAYEGYYVNPSFFAKAKDGSYTFKAITGSYQIKADAGLKYLQVRPLNSKGELATLQSDGTGAVWIIGSNIGLPSVKTNVTGWTTEKGIAMAQVSKAVYEITLVGQQEVIGADFKFFGQAGWGIEFHGTSDNGYCLKSESDIWDVQDNGNTKLKDGAKIDYGSTYVLTVDLSKGVAAGVLKSTTKASETKFEPTFNGTVMQSADGSYAWNGMLSQGKKCTFGGVDEFKAEGFYVDPDFFKDNGDGTYTFLPITGTYTVAANFTLNYIKVFASTNGKPSTYDTATGSGEVWTIGDTGIGKPSYKTNSQDWWTDLRYCNALAQISPKVYRISLTAGQELRYDNNYVSFKFFGQAGWGTEFKENPTITLDDNTGLFVVNNGNINLKEGAKLTKDMKYVFTLNCSNPTNAQLTITAEHTAGINAVEGTDEEKDAPYYTISGMKVVAPSAPGIYIHNGKKVLVK